MQNKSVLAFIAVLCMALIVVTAMGVSAVGDDGGLSSDQISTSSEESSEIGSSSSESSSDENISSSEESSSTNSESKEDLSSDADSSESTSSGNTSSKKPIHTDGGGGGNFIEQNVTSSAGSLVSSQATSMIDGEYDEDYDDDEDHYVAQSGSAAKELYVIIGVVTVIAVLCIAGLIVVNVMFRKKYPKKSGAARRNPSATRRKK